MIPIRTGSKTGFEILLFGATADAVGAHSLTRSASTELNASELVVQLKEEYPKLAKHMLLVSINQEYAGGDDPIRDGDEVAIFTAVSGG